MALSRAFIVNRVFVANKWLQQHTGRSVGDAAEADLKAFLDGVPDAHRERTLAALVAYGDDLVRKGRARRNIARVIQLP